VVTSFTTFALSYDSTQEPTPGKLKTRINNQRSWPELREGQIVMVDCAASSSSSSSGLLHGRLGVVESRKKNMYGKLQVRFPHCKQLFQLRAQHLRSFDKSIMFEPGDKVQINNFDEELPMILNNSTGIVTGFPDPVEEKVSVLVPTVRPFPLNLHPKHLHLILPVESPETKRRRIVDYRIGQFEEDDSRHFLNRIDERFPGGALVRPWRTAALKLLQNLSQKFHPPITPLESVYRGELGVLLGVWTTSNILKISSSAKMQGILRACLGRIDVLEDLLPEYRHTFLHGLAGGVCTRVAMLHALGELREARQHAEKCLMFLPNVKNLEKEVCSLAIGRAGYLYSIGFIRRILKNESFGFVPFSLFLSLFVRARARVCA